MQIPHYSLTLNVNAQKSTQAIIAKQHDDKSRYIDIILVADDKPVVLNKERVTLTAFDKKLNETIAVTDCTIVNGVIVAELTAAILSTATTLDCEITVYGTSKEIITSARFICIVDSKLSTEVVEREPDFSALQTALADVASTSNRIDEVSSRTQPVALGGTGATTAYQATQSLKTMYLGAISTVPSNSDLNDYTTDGTFDIGASVSATISNAPTTGNTYKLIVMHIVASSLTQQIAIVPGKNALFMRNCLNGTWSTWTKIMSYNPQIDEVGTWEPTLSGEGSINVAFANYVYDGTTCTITTRITAGNDITDNTLTLAGLPIAPKYSTAITVYVGGTSVAHTGNITGGQTKLVIRSDGELTNKLILITATYIV